MRCLATNCFRNFALINFYAGKTILSILSRVISVNFSCKQIIAYFLQIRGLSKIITSFVSRMIKNYHTRDQTSCRWSRPQFHFSISWTQLCHETRSSWKVKLENVAAWRARGSRVSGSIRHLLNSK